MQIIYIQGYSFEQQKKKKKKETKISNSIDVPQYLQRIDSRTP